MESESISVIKYNCKRPVIYFIPIRFFLKNFLKLRNELINLIFYAGRVLH